MRWYSKLAAAALAALLQACAAGPAVAPMPAAVAETREPVTILVSIDGFRPDYVTPERTPNLHALATESVVAEMRPSFPVMTIPNHYTLITGLRPDRHGIVDNNIEDPERPGARFHPTDPAQARDPFWWDGAEPLWITAERAGIRTGILYWVGADVAIRGARPGIWWPFDRAVTSQQRTETLLDWLRRPEAGRPRFLALYFDVVDRMSHAPGWGSPELAAAITEVDTEIGRLRAGLAAIGQPANLLVVSDHGMTPVPPEHEMDPAEVVDEATMRWIVAGPMLYIFPKPGSEAAAEARVLRPHPHAQCWRKSEIPARFHYGRNPRVSPLVCLAESGWRFWFNRKPDYVMGDHGFDNDEPGMRAMFLANGPAFRPGAKLPVFDNVDVYPLLRRLIGLGPAADVDGSDAVFAPVLANP